MHWECDYCWKWQNCYNLDWDSFWNSKLILVKYTYSTLRLRLIQVKYTYSAPDWDSFRSNTHIQLQTETHSGQIHIFSSRLRLIPVKYTYSGQDSVLTHTYTWLSGSERVFDEPWNRPDSFWSPSAIDLEHWYCCSPLAWNSAKFVAKASNTVHIWKK